MFFLYLSERINTWPFYQDAAVTEDTKLRRDLEELETTILMQANRTLFSMTSITCSDKNAREMLEFSED
jgi:hypothetical protein